MRAQELRLKESLDTLYKEYNCARYIQYDPIKYVHDFEDETEMELMALIASSLSFGRVTQIFKALDRLLDIFNHGPLKYVSDLKERPDPRLISFQYRFVTGLDVFKLLLTAQRIIKEFGSIGQFARKHYGEGGLQALADDIIRAFQDVHYLIPSSLRKSPCKRLFMFFRWMVRHDNIDLGFWNFIPTGELVMPLDTHIFRVSRELCLTRRCSASLNTAIEITENLRTYSGSDPVKYDWALSHMGIIKNNFATKSSRR